MIRAVNGYASFCTLFDALSPAMLKDFFVSREINEGAPIFLEYISSQKDILIQKIMENFNAMT